MREDVFDERPFTPAASEGPAGCAAYALPETPAIMPGEPAPVPRSVRRGRLPRWLLVALVGMLALAVLAGGIAQLISLLHRAANQTPASFVLNRSPCSTHLTARTVPAGNDESEQDHFQQQLHCFGDQTTR